jgi:hypothetical protein
VRWYFEVSAVVVSASRGAAEMRVNVSESHIDGTLHAPGVVTISD